MPHSHVGDANTRMIFDLWRGQPGKFFCIATKGEAGWRNHFFTRAEFKDIDEFLAEHDEEDLYWCPHGFIRRSRLAEHACESNLLWADLDMVDPRKLELKPTIAWETSSRRYAALWKLDAEPSRGLRKRFNDAIGPDTGGWCLSKVLRGCCLHWAEQNLHSGVTGEFRRFPHGRAALP